jgi:hypothetical protein
VLGQYKAISADRTISLKDGTGFAFNQPGQYTLTAEFSMGHPADFAQFADQAKPAVGSKSKNPMEGKTKNNPLTLVTCS